MEMQKKMYLVLVLEYTCYEYFQEIGSKVLLSIFCGTKINLEWITLPFLNLPPIKPYPPNH